VLQCEVTPEVPLNGYILVGGRLSEGPMSAAGERKAGYGRSFVVNGSEEDSSGESKDRIELLVRRSLGLMTGGCELCVYSVKLFCEKYKKPVKIGDPRCASFSRRQSSLSEDLF